MSILQELILFNIHTTLDLEIDLHLYYDFEISYDELSEIKRWFLISGRNLFFYVLIKLITNKICCHWISLDSALYSAILMRTSYFHPF